jgi:hypothetical protein
MSTKSESHEIGGQHINHHQRTTLESLFAHPTRHNIRWKEVEHLLAALGDVVVQHNGHLRVTLSGIVEVFDVNHGKDLTLEQVMDLRRMLTSAGFDPAGADLDA